MSNVFRTEKNEKAKLGNQGSISVHICFCLRYHTLGFVESQGIMFAFGRGEQGQLGSGQTNNQTVPLPVDLPQGKTSLSLHT